MPVVEMPGEGGCLSPSRSRAGWAALTAAAAAWGARWS